MSPDSSGTPSAKSLVDTAVAHYGRLGWPKPRLALISGSGLSVDLGTPLHPPVSLGEILGQAVHGIEGHPLRVEIVEVLPGHPVLYFRGRVHGYQGHPPALTVLPVRLAAALGATGILLTNAAGGVCPERQRAGDLVLITDQINLTGTTPLLGDLPAEWGPRFPIMVDAYDHGMRRLALAKGRGLGIDLEEGVYAGLLGPAYETPAEARMLNLLGAHLTGMSTVLEVIAARQMGVRCFGLSLVTNIAATAEADHEEVLASGRAAALKVQRLLGAMLADPALYV
ncbi:MAG: purine-nucleoside phosphorylase [Acidobacteriota bacterium]